MNHRQLARHHLAQAVEVARHIDGLLSHEQVTDVESVVISVPSLRLLVRHALDTAETLTSLIDTLDAIDAGGQGNAEA